MLYGVLIINETKAVIVAVASTNIVFHLHGPTDK